MSTVVELRALAKEQGYTGYSRLCKQELIDLLDKRGSKKCKKSYTNSGKKSRNIWTIYTLKGCGACLRSKDILSKNNQPYKEIEVTDSNEDAIYKKIDKKTGSYRYFPIIFHNSTFIGGMPELRSRFS